MLIRGRESIPGGRRDDRMRSVGKNGRKAAAPDDVIATLNEKYAVVLEGGKCAS